MLDEMLGTKPDAPYDFLPAKLKLTEVSPECRTAALLSGELFLERGGWAQPLLFDLAIRTPPRLPQPPHLQSGAHKCPGDAARVSRPNPRGIDSVSWLLSPS